ncbi:MAG: aromatic ring-hydroxylating dioxygenase subunit alpha [Acidimicrobiales bacterium]|jgi:phenylpropionate dioxygenase-like ring-hydroxylating dioxygenase large terminal subunit|nr:aromatic ring-hydroxylating dioxygenase subunit alpha [Acidimicrobiales bacterium]
MSDFPEVLQNHWYAVGTSDSLDFEVLSVRLLSKKFVLWRTPDGEIGAALDSCPHRQAPLSKGTLEEGCLRCPYHGWLFGDKGRCLEVPSAKEGLSAPPKANLEFLNAQEKYGLIWVCPGEPLAPIPEVAADRDESFTRINTEMQIWNVDSTRMIDNMLDISHFPYTHRGTFGIEQETVVPKIKLEQLDETYYGYRYEVKINNVGSTKIMSGGGADVIKLFMTTGFALPFSVLSTMTYETGVEQKLFMTAAPIEEGRSIYTFVLWRNDDVDLLVEPGRTVANEVLDLELAVVLEDQMMLEKLQGQLPLERGALVDVQADKPSLEWRRRYKELVSS